MPKAEYTFAFGTFEIPYEGTKPSQAEAEAYVRESLKASGVVNLPGREPSLTQGPYPGPTQAAPPRPPDPLPTAYQLPAELGLGLAGGVGGGMLAGAGGAIGGSAAGQIAATELNRRVVAPMLGFAPPKPSFSQDPMRELAMQGVVGAGAELIPGVGRGLLRRAITGRAKPGAARTLQAFQEAGVSPKVTDISESRVPAQLQAFAQQTLTGAPVIDRAMRGQIEGLQTYAQREFLDRLGPMAGQSDLATGIAAQTAITQNVARGRGLEDQLWQGMAPIWQGVPADVPGLRQFAQEIIERKAEGLTKPSPQLVGIAEEILERTQQAVPRLSSSGQPMLAAAPGGLAPTPIPFEIADKWRKDLGALLGQPALISGVDQGSARHMYGLLLTDMEQAAAQSGNPNLQAAYARVRGFSERLRELYRDGHVAQVIDLTPEQVIQRIKAANGLTEITAWRDAMLGNLPGLGRQAQDVEAWNLVRRHVFESILGETTHGAGKAIERAPRGLTVDQLINGRQLTRQINAIGDEKLSVLLNPIERRVLDNVAEVANALRRGERVGASAFTSSTGQIMGILFTMATGGGAAAAIMGQTGAGLATMVATLLTPVMIARMLTNPQMAAELASSGFARLGQEFTRRHLTREGTATMIRLLGALQQAQPATPSGAGAARTPAP